jgi:hypothetical protein
LNFTGNLALNDGNLILPNGNILSTLGNIVLSNGNILSTVGNLVLSNGNLGITTGNVIMSNGNLGITTGNVTLSSGNLGIGITNPQHAFDMVGTANITGTLRQYGIQAYLCDNSPYLFELGAGASGVFIDFHSSSSTTNDYDSRIIATGGTSATGQGNIRIEGQNVSVNNLLSTGVSTILGQSPFMIQYGITSSGTSGTVTFGTSYSATPTILQGWQRGSAVDSVYMTSVTTTGFTWGATTSVIVHWLAIGLP